MLRLGMLFAAVDLLDLGVTVQLGMDVEVIDNLSFFDNSRTCLVDSDHSILHDQMEVIINHAKILLVSVWKSSG
jgi:hypothetical protein